MTAVALCNSHHDEAKWLELRQNYVTASDVATVMGLSPWATPLQLYMQKLGLMPGPDESEAMYWGKKLEPLVVAELAERTGRQVVHAADLRADMFTSEKYPWLACTIDGQQWVSGVGPFVVEAKTAGPFAMGKWDDGIPENYVIQAQVQMLVMESSMNTVCGLMSGQRYTFDDLRPDLDMFTKIVEVTKDFHRRVELGRRQLEGEDVEIDPPQATASDRPALTVLYPVEDPGSVVMWGQDEIAIHDELVEAKEDRNKAKERIEELNTELIALIGNNEKAIMPGMGAYTYKANTNGTRILRYSEKG